MTHIYVSSGRHGLMNWDRDNMADMYVDDNLLNSLQLLDNIRHLCDLSVSNICFWNNCSLPGYLLVIMMTSSNGIIFRVTGPLCGIFTGHRWIPHTKASDAELWCSFDLRLNKRLSKQSRGWWFEMPSRSLWRHCNVPLYINKILIKKAI